MRRRLWVSLISTVTIVLVLFIGNIVTGNTPILGLDLQGGVSVILAPVEPATGDDLLVIRDLIRSELENRGIAEPDVRVQGQTIVVDLPGVKDQQAALDAVDVSGVVELRPVVNMTECTSAGVTPGDVTQTSIPLDTVPVGSDAIGSNAVTSDPATSAPAGFRARSRRRRFPTPNPSPRRPPRHYRPGRPRTAPSCCRPATAAPSVSGRRRAPARCSPTGARR